MPLGFDLTRMAPPSHSLVKASIAVAVAVAALVVAVVGGCHKSQAAPVAERPPAPVVAVAAVAQDVPVYLDEIGRAAPRESVTVQPQVTGKVTEIHFTDGAMMKKGDLLYRIDPRPFQATLAQVQATLAQNRADLNWARSELTRFTEIQNTGAVSKIDIAQKQNAVNVADAKVAAAQAAIQTATLNLEYCEITSPIDGRAGQHLVDVGNVVSSSGPDGGSKLLVIQRFDPIYVDFTITEQKLLDVRNYMAATGKLKTLAWIPEDEKNPREGELTFLDNAVLPGAGTVKLRATLANSDGHFWPGQFVKVRLVLDTKKDAVLVPARAQQIGQQGPYVYVVTQGEVVNPVTKGKQSATIAELRPITPGQPQGEMLVIREGLKSGEQVVIEGQMSVTPGGKVQVLPAPAPKSPASQPAVAQGNLKP